MNYLAFSATNDIKISYLRWQKMGPKIWSFLSFALYKEKNIPKCSLELDDSKNIYCSRVIFNIFRRNTPPFPILCEIYKIPFLAINMKSGGICPLTIVVSVACSISCNNRYIIIVCMLLQTCRLNNRVFIIPVNNRHET